MAVRSRSKQRKTEPGKMCPAQIRSKDLSHTIADALLLRWQILDVGNFKCEQNKMMRTGVYFQAGLMVVFLSECAAGNNGGATVKGRKQRACCVESVQEGRHNAPQSYLFIAIKYAWTL